MAALTNFLECAVCCADSNCCAEPTTFNVDIGSWNVASVTSLSSVFYGASAFNQNIGKWTTASCANFASAFYKAAAFNQNIGSWNFAAATTVSSMFQVCAFSSCRASLACRAGPGTAWSLVFCFRLVARVRALPNMVMRMRSGFRARPRSTRTSAAGTSPRRPPWCPCFRRAPFHPCHASLACRARLGTAWFARFVSSRGASACVAE